MAFALASRKALQVTCKATGKKTAAKVSTVGSVRHYLILELVCCLRDPGLPRLLLALFAESVIN